MVNYIIIFNTMATNNNGYQSPEEMYQMIEQLKQELKLEKEKKIQSSTKFELKVSPKGCCSVYMGKKKWPVSLYKSDWKLILSKKDEILKFLEDNADKLASKESDASESA